MRNIWVIAVKEWKNYLYNPVGYIFAGLLLLVANWLYMGDLFVTGQADLRSYWGMFGFLLSIFVPAITMGLIADEKKNGTWEVLLSLPVSEIELVLGKFLGAGLYFLLVLGLTLPVCLVIILLGKPDSGMVVGGYVGILLLGLSYLAVGLFASSLTSQAVAGFLGAVVFLLVNSLISQETVLMRMPVMIKNIMTSLSLGVRGGRFSGGLIEVNDLVFFVSWILVFIILTVMSLKSRNK